MINLLLLLTAITLEVCGDASFRIAMRGGKPLAYLLGGALVICYGMIVNLPNWSFSRTMGVYIAVFFIVSQCVSRVVLLEHLKLPTIVGGILIVSGGLIILLWRPT